MKKKVKKKTTSALNVKAADPPKKGEKEEKQFDFGGLPDRNLKKNLGC